MKRPQFMWVTISKATGYMRFAPRRKDCTTDSPWLHGPFKVRTEWLPKELLVETGGRRETRSVSRRQGLR